MVWRTSQAVPSRALSALLGAGCLLFAMNAVAAGEQLLKSEQYAHQWWTIRDGAPSGVCALAQAPDGYLWLGTGAGLYRFDGVQFTRYQPDPGQRLTSDDITALMFASDGSLWMGSYYGGGTRLRNGRLTSYSGRDDFPAGWVLDFAEGPDGEIWAATGQGLGRFDGTHWQRIGSDWGYPANRADWVVFDTEGTLWAAATNRLVYLPRGEKRFKATNVALAPGAVLAIDRHGTLWASDRLHGTRPLRGLSAQHPQVDRLDQLPVSDEGAATRLMFDRNGALWASSLGTGGVFRVANPDDIALGQNVTSHVVTDVFMAPRNLTSDNAIPVLEDREGNVWIGTNLGVDSYRQSKIGTLSDFRRDPHAHINIAKDPDGHIWLSNKGAVYRIEDDKLIPVLGGLQDILSVLVTARDTFWVVGRHDLYRDRSGKLERIPVPGHLYSSRLKFVAEGGDGALWTSIEGLGIFRFRDDAWQKWTPATPNVARSPTAGAVGADGSRWFGYVGGELLFVDRAGHERFYGFPHGADIGTIDTISVGPGETLFGGDSGLARVKNGVIQSITNLDSPVLSGVTGIVRLDSGDVWLNTGHGIVRYASAELDRAFDQPSYRPRYDVFDSRDGVQGVALQGQPVSTLQVDRAGRIWFATNETIQWLDPASHYYNPVPPPVYVRYVAADGREYGGRSKVTLPNGTRALQIGYTALSLSSPARVSFRYWLEGSDKDWQEAGTRREAYYTNLSPGTYRFHVTAANEDGVWNGRGTGMTIVIPPLFYQTGWFHLLAALLVVALLWLAMLARMRRVARSIRMQSEVRHEERERIARDLHDTLLQAVHALMLRFQSIAAAIPRDDPLQEGIRSTMRVASNFITDGRDRVKALRAALGTTMELSEAIVELAVGLGKASSITVETTEKIEPEDIDPALGDGVFSICREALVNAFRHANASVISVGISCDRKRLSVSIGDNGSGIATPLLEELARRGHWGIVGMRERALTLGIRLSINSTNAGTIVELHAPLAPGKRIRPKAGPRSITRG